MLPAGRLPDPSGRKNIYRDVRCPVRPVSHLGLFPEHDIPEQLQDMEDAGPGPRSDVPQDLLIFRI